MDEEGSESTISIEPFVENHDLLDFEPGDELQPYHPGMARLLTEAVNLEDGGAISPPTQAGTCVFTSIPIKSEPIDPLFVEQGLLIDLTQSDNEQEVEMIELVVPTHGNPETRNTQAGASGLAHASPEGPLKSSNTSQEMTTQQHKNPPPINKSNTRKRKRLRRSEERRVG